MRYRIISLAAASLVMGGSIAIVFGSFDLSWYTVDSGGGTSSSASGLEITGTVGQPDASAQAAMTGGNFALTGGFWAFAGSPCTAFAPVDFDRDCDVDLDDLAVFESCLSGPMVPRVSSPACQAADLDGDNDVDERDFGIFQRCFSGAGIVADPDCAH